MSKGARAADVIAAGYGSKDSPRPAGPIRRSISSANLWPSPNVSGHAVVPGGKVSPCQAPGASVMIDAYFAVVLLTFLTRTCQGARRTHGAPKFCPSNLALRIRRAGGQCRRRRHCVYATVSHATHGS